MAVDSSSIPQANRIKDGPIIDLQLACEDKRRPPSVKDFEKWVVAVLASDTQERKAPRNSEITIRLVDEQESRTLNKTYRGKDKPTNVLSFPADLPDNIDIPLLGDLVICAAVVEQEAERRNKTALAHWAHITVHGTLHLLGYDHIDDTEAEQMESIETHIVMGLGYPSPYEST